LIKEAGIKLVKDFPADSPDMNPIEKVWSFHKQEQVKRAQQEGVPTTEEGMQSLIVRAWQNVDPEVVRKTMRGLNKVKAKVVRHEGRFPVK
jgi:hypothetical protein